MSRARLAALALASGLLAVGGIAVALGGLAAVLVTLVRGQLPWTWVGVAAVVLGGAMYLLGVRLAYRQRRGMRSGD